jgi:hypothetical protein
MRDIKMYFNWMSEKAWELLTFAEHVDIVITGYTPDK